MTAQTPTSPRRQTFVKRRFFWLFLPIISLGAVVYLVASAATMTINGLGLLGVGVIGLGVIAAAWDAGERS